MPRPPFAPTREQRQALARIESLARCRAGLDAETDQALAAAAALGIPYRAIGEAAGGADWETIKRRLARISTPLPPERAPAMTESAVRIDGEITHKTLNIVDAIEAITAPRLTVHINSPGGDAHCGHAIYVCLKSHPARVEVRVEGVAAGVACLVAMAGDEIVIDRAAQMAVMPSRAVAVGDVDEMRRMADVIAGMDDRIAGVYAQRCGGTVEDWRERMLAETWYTAPEAVRAGLADLLGNELTPGGAYPEPITPGSAVD